MLSTEGFKEFAKDVVLFTHITTRIEGDKYAELLSEKGGNGFPYVVAMDAEGNVLSELGDRSVDGFKAMMKGAGEYQSLRAKKDHTPAETLKLLGMDLARGRIKGPEYKEKAGALKGLDEAAVKERDSTVLNIDITAELDRFRGAKGPDPALRIEVGKAFAGMHKAGRVPAEKRFIGPFYEIMLDYAESGKDADLFAVAFGKLKDNFGDQKRLEPFWTKLQERLDAIKAGGAEKKEEKKEEKKGEPGK